MSFAGLSWWRKAVIVAVFAVWWVLARPFVIADEINMWRERRRALRQGGKA